MRDDSDLFDFICAEVYGDMCDKCERQWLCEESCTECEEFEQAVEEAYVDAIATRADMYYDMWRDSLIKEF